jgi:hypothetical protein
MAKQATTNPVPATSPRSTGTLTATVLAIAAAAACIAVGVLSLDALNPDGVAYLDLAGAMQHGDWLHFVQGYWSPLFPFLVGGIGAATGWSGGALVAVTHVVNLVAALAAVAILWRWLRRPALAGAAPAGFAALLICSAGLPRIEAVTPDVILLFLLVALSCELIAQAGRRWLLVGLLLGLAFLAKTSCWPWLLAAIPIRLWAARQPGARTAVVRSFLVCAVVMLSWVLPMSLKYGRPTLGSSGTLNWSWYIAANSSRLPDTDAGSNRDYHDVPVGNGRLLTVATFNESAYWTYQPWDDPTDWATRVQTQTGRTPDLFELATYWARTAARVFGLWLGPLIVAVLLPFAFLHRRAGMVRELFTAQRDAAAVLLLGLVGLLQFVAVHAEPRLIGPFAAMLAIGTIAWCVAAPARATAPPLRHTLTWLGLIVAAGFAVPRLVEGAQSAVRLRDVTARLTEMRRRIALAGNGPAPVAVVGPAAPVMASAYLANVHIAMQLAPRFADLVATLPPAEQREMLLTLFRGKVPMIWRTTSDGAIEMLLVDGDGAAASQ